MFKIADYYMKNQSIFINFWFIITDMFNFSSKYCMFLLVTKSKPTQAIWALAEDMVASDLARALVMAMEGMVLEKAALDCMASANAIPIINR